MRIWRLTKSKHAATSFSGDGARLYGDRWNPKGVSFVYTSQTPSLSVLEQLVHMDPDDMSDFAVIYADIPDELVEVFDTSTLGSDWQSATDKLQTAGAGWVQTKRFAALAVPSAIIPEEYNVLLNPLHVDFPRVTIGPPKPFVFDPRLHKS